MAKNWLNKKLIVGLLAAAMLVLAGCSNNAETVATVDGEKITKDDLYDVLVGIYGPDAVEALIDEKIVELEVKKADIEIPEEEIEKEMEQFKEEVGGEEAFEAALAGRDLSEDDFKKDIVQYLSIRKLMEPLVDLSDEEIEAYFEEHKDQFGEPEQVEARHIIVEDEKTAKELHEELKNGADFAELAKEHSTDGSAAAGGDLGFFPREGMDPAFVDKAFSMKVGELSGPVKSSFGYHLIEVLDKKEAVDAKLKDHEEEIKEKLFEEKMQTEYVTWLEEKRDEYDIKNELFGESEVPAEDMPTEDSPTEETN